MKKRLFGMIALLIAFSMIFATVVAMAAPEGESADIEATVAEGESAEGESDAVAADAAAEGESAEGESDAAAAEGESGEDAAAEGESADSEGDAADGAAPAAVEPDYSAVQDYDYKVIEADGEQARLTYVPSVTEIIEVDGLSFVDIDFFRSCYDGAGYTG